MRLLLISLLVSGLLTGCSGGRTPGSEGTDPVVVLEPTPSPLAATAAAVATAGVRLASPTIMTPGAADPPTPEPPMATSETPTASASPTVAPTVTPSPTITTSPTEEVNPVDPAALTPSVYAGTLEQPVALAWARDGRLFVAELVTGNVRVVGPEGTVQPEPVVQFQVAHPPGYSEHGLLGLALHPEFDQNRLVYVFYSVPDEGGNPVKQVIVRFQEEDGRMVGEPEIIVDNLAVGPTCCHNGGRIAFGPDGKLYVTVGDTQVAELAQQTDDLAGNILRYNDDGTIPDDGPFGPGNPVWAIGQRNPFGLAFDPATGELFATENGPGVDDEVNIIEAGGNYGWPLVTGRAERAGLIDPIWVMEDTVAPTGAVVYRGETLADADGDLFFCNWNDGRLRQIEHDGSNERQYFDECLTDVSQGPDGALYFAGADSIFRAGP